MTTTFPLFRIVFFLFAMIIAAGLAGCGDDDDPTGPIEQPDPPPGAETATVWDPADFTTVLDVGPGHDLADPTEVPWESLAPSTLVRIHHREQPYRTKFVLTTEATADQPLVVLGVPDPTSGQRPVISGDGAVTRLELDYWNEDRSVVKVGGSSIPGGDNVPSFIVIQGLEIRTGRPGYSFTDDAGNTGSYVNNAAALHVEEGANVTIEDCVLADCGNGLFAGSQASDLTIRGNHIHGNGIEGRYYEHNSYTECLGIVFEFNRYGPLRDGCGGNNLKDRSAGTVIRYNWIEGGNRQLDLVETGHEELRGDPRYRQTFVYGNLLLETENTGNSQIVHYGGDGGDESWYRKGTLYFYHNTVLSTRSGNTTLLRLSSADESADVRNCAVHAGSLAISNDAGSANLTSCWLTDGWRDTHNGSMSGSVSTSVCLVGVEPGCEDFGGFDLEPSGGSPLLGAAGELAEEVGRHGLGYQYLPHQGGEERGDSGAAIGALGASR